MVAPTLSAAEYNILIAMFSAIHQHQAQSPMPQHFIVYMTHELQYLCTGNGYTSAEAARAAWVKGHIKSQPLTKVECKLLNKFYKEFRDNYGWKFKNEFPPAPKKKPPPPPELPKSIGGKRIIDY